MIRFTVYTKQINADAFDVEAKDFEDARQKAKALWQQNYGFEAQNIEVNDL